MTQAIPGQPKDPNRLDSWKEISAYLNVTPRTAQNWERRGLPVHRPSGQRGPVFAYRSELDSWLHKGDSDSSRDSTRGWRPELFLWLGGLPRLGKLLVLPAILAVALVAFTVAPWKDRNPASGIAEFRHFTVLNQDGDPLWTSPELMGRHAAGLQASGEPRINNFLLLEDIDGDGLSEVFFVDFPSYPEQGAGVLLAFQADGTPLWKQPVHFGRHIQWGDRELNCEYSSERPPLIFRAGGETFLAVFGQHSTWFPSLVLAVRASDGECIGEYWHPGRFTGVLLRDFDQDGQEEFIFTGVNNPGPGEGRAFVSRVAVQDLLASRFDPEDPFGFEQSAAADYLLFDNTDLAKARAVRNTTLRLAWLGPEKIRFGILPGGFFGNIDPTFQAIQFEASDDFQRLHREMEMLGQIKHEFSVQEIQDLKVLRFQHRHPNANSPEIQNAFDMD